jgi:hypothetical protein
VVRNLAFLVIIFACVVGLFFGIYSIYYSGSRANPSEQHFVTFDPVGCFSCYGCTCTFRVDGSKTYVLNEYYKTRCLKYQLEPADYKRSSVRVPLRGQEYVDFIKCVEKYDGVTANL